MMKKNRLFSIIKILLTTTILAVIVYFISVELQRNRLQFGDIMDNINWLPLSAAVGSLIAYFLIASVGLRFLLNRGAPPVKLSVAGNFGIINISGLTKYLPGKVWSYAIMFFALNEIGMPLSKAVLDSMIHLILTVATPILLMIPVAVFAFLPRLSMLVKIVLITSGVSVYVLCLVFSPILLKIILRVVNTFRKKEPILYSLVNRKDIFKTQGIVLSGYFFYVLSVVIVIFSIDQNANWSSAIQIAVFCVFSAIVGFLALFVPGGLGVQESLIYFYATVNHADPGFALLLPIVVRLVSVITDLMVGLTSLWLIRKIAAKVVFAKKQKVIK